jgi:hypothetical protein
MKMMAVARPQGTNCFLKAIFLLIPFSLDVNYVDDVRTANHCDHIVP